MKTKWVDFKAVKATVSIEAVLNHYGIKLRRVNQTYFRGPCPLPTHTSADSKESFGVNLAKNVWACQSSSCVKARGGRKGGNILDLTSTLESCSVREAALKLAEWFSIESSPGPSQEAVPVKEEKPELVGEKKTSQSALAGGGESESEEGNKPLGFTLKGIDSSHPYLEQRGIARATAEHFGVGLFSGKGLMAGRIVLPVANEKGELVAYAGRAIDDSEPKYKFPVGFKKSLVLFNLHRVLKKKHSWVVIVEGFFDCMKVEQAGYDCVALMGSSLSNEQARLLLKHFGYFVLMFDGDEAGKTATEECARLLIRQCWWLQIVMLPEGKQPDTLSSEEIDEYLGPRLLRRA